MTSIALAQKLSSLNALEMDMETFHQTALVLQSQCVKVKHIYCPLRIQSHETEFASLNRAYFYLTHTALEPCSDPEDIQLARYISDTFGRLEVCSGGYWGTVCGIGATDAIAKVACRQLNHAATGTYMCICNYSEKQNNVSYLQGWFMWKVISLIIFFVLFPLRGLTWCAVVMRMPYQSADIVELMETLPVNMTLTSLFAVLVRVTTKLSP